MISINSKYLEMLSDKDISNIGWDNISKFNMSNGYVKKHIDKLDWVELEKKNLITAEFRKECPDKFNEMMLLSREKVVNNYIEEMNKGNFGKDFLSQQSIFNIILTMIRNPSTYFNESLPLLKWEIVSLIPNIPDWFLKRFEHKLNWETMSWSQALSESFIEENADKLNWSWICRNQKLSEEFMRKNSHRIVWEEISWAQDLSQKFLVDFAGNGLA